MAERRAIKSTIWDDTWFGRLAPFQMVVWIGLFSKCADDQGRLQDDPALIRSKLFPFQDVTIKEIADAMDAFNGHLIRYTKGEQLAQITRWWDNQPMQYATPSNFPPPDGWVDCYRTNYKKVYIVFNWTDAQDTKTGVLLWEGLSVLLRPSSWITYLGRLNYTPNYTPTPNQEEPKREPTAPAPESFATSIYNGIAGGAGLPMSESKDITSACLILMGKYKTIEAVKGYLKPFYAAFIDSKPRNRGRAYWLYDWGIAGQIPNEKSNGNGSKPTRGRDFLAAKIAEIEAQEEANGNAS